jgi:hypothetical protein
MEKSAQMIDGKGVGSAPLPKRVRNRMKTKGIDEKQVGRLKGSQVERYGGQREWSAWKSIGGTDARATLGEMESRVHDL